MFGLGTICRFGFFRVQLRFRSGKSKPKPGKVGPPKGNGPISLSSFGVYQQKLDELNRLLQSLPSSHFIWRKCKGLGIDRKIYRDAIAKFAAALNKNEIPNLTKEKLISDEVTRSFDRLILPHFFWYVQNNYNVKSDTFGDLMLLSDLRSPAEWYPEARKLKRKIIMHVGPTNSGKTYHALKRFKEATNAIYCGPLRLLAHEVYERSNQEGVPCNLLTGEERRESDGVGRWSCTVEMTQLSKQFDVAVIDEIQMIGDQFRGNSWTRALLGLQANEIHLCGEPTAVDLIKRICEETEDEVEVRHYTRLCPLAIDKTSLKGSFKNVKPGDCIVTFSRKSIYSIKSDLEKANRDLRVAIIYGSLPAEARAEQARVFNDPDSPFNVLVATDAIGMGLNLNIRRIVLESLQKFDGEVVRYLTVSQAKQIAGRAGRYNSQYPNGLVTTLEQVDHPMLKKYMSMEAEELQSAGIEPELEQLKRFSEVIPNARLPELFERFDQIATVDSNFFLTNLRDKIKLAKLLNEVELTLRDHYLFTMSPTTVHDDTCVEALIHFSKHHSNGMICTVDDIHKIERGIVDINSLKKLESQHRVYVLYLWLAMRYPETFTDAEQVAAKKRLIEEGINEVLLTFRYAHARSPSDTFEFIDAYENKPDSVEVIPVPGSVVTRKRKRDYVLGGDLAQVAPLPYANTTKKDSNPDDDY